MRRTVHDKAREWLEEHVYYPDPDDDTSDDTTEAKIALLYVGGWAQFVRDAT